MTTYLYWIHYPDHSDPLTEGYIGITNNPKRRHENHKNSTQNLMVKGALKKGAVMTLLKSFSSDAEALREEERMRPTELIGWNIIKGGGKPPAFNPTPENRARVSVQFKGKKHSAETIRKRSQARKGFKHTEKTKQILAKRATTRHIIWVSCLSCKKQFDFGNFSKNHGEKCGIKQGDAWNTGIQMTERTCPKCGTTGRGGNMARYHFDNCGLVKEKHITVKKTCPHCGFNGAGGNMTRYHFNNCRHLDSPRV